MVKPTLYTSPGSWIEGAALQQLDQTAALPGMDQIEGMPDLTPSKGCAVGTVAFSRTTIYPHLVGNDIGCGYSLFRTDIDAAKFRPERALDKLVGLDNEYATGKIWLDIYSVASDHLQGLGTIGGGNHFCELQRLHEVQDRNILAQHKLDPNKLVLLVHSGSRSLGESIFRDVSAHCGAAGLVGDSPEGIAYMAAHDTAVRWASANRALIAKRFLECLSAFAEAVQDIPHNFVEPYWGGFLHRKGAAPSSRGLSPLPGSRGSISYLVQPCPHDGLASLAHGAGRKFSRAGMHGRVQDSAKQMTTTPFGGSVVCGNDLLMREEHPSAYKAIDQVLADLVEHGLAKPVASLVPLLTYKSERNPENATRVPKREKEDGWRRERREHNRGGR